MDKLDRLRAQRYNQYDSGNQGSQYENFENTPSNDYSYDYNNQNTNNNYGGDANYGNQGQYGNNDYGNNYASSPQVQLPPAVVSASPAANMSDFLSEIEAVNHDIKNLNDMVASIRDIQARLASAVDDARNNKLQEDLNRTNSDARDLSTQLKNHIKALENQTARSKSSPDYNMRKNQISSAKAHFVKALQTYQDVQRDAREKQRGRIQRKYKVMNPDATDDEVQRVVDSDQGDQMFAQALVNSSRYGEVRAAQREVQNRRADIKRIEVMLVQLAELIDDMATLVEEQDNTLNTIGATTGEVKQQTVEGEKKLQGAIKSLRSSRRKRWICFFICLIIVAIIAIVLAVHFTS